MDALPSISEGTESVEDSPVEIPTLKIPIEEYEAFKAAAAACLDCARWTDTYHLRLADSLQRLKEVELEFNPHSEN